MWQGRWAAWLAELPWLRLMPGRQALRGALLAEPWPSVQRARCRQRCKRASLSSTELSNSMQFEVQLPTRA